MYFRTTNRSSDRNKTGVIDIGRKSLGCVANLGVGIMMAVFHWRGTTPVASDWRNKLASGAAKIGAPSRRSQAGIWSSSVVVGRSVSNIRNTSISVMTQIFGCRQFQPGCSVVVVG